MSEWREIPGHAGYEVSDDGLVRCWRRLPNARDAVTEPRPVKQRTVQGYEVVYMHEDGRTRWHKVHRLVMQAFVGPLPPGMVTRHRDGNAKNNSLANLAYGTQAENIADKSAHGTMARGDRHGSKTRPESLRRGDSHPMRARPELVRRGEAHSMSKLSEASVKLMRYLRAAHDAPTSALSDWFVVTNESVNNVLSRRTWSHVA